MQSQVERLDLIRRTLDERKTISTREIMQLCQVSFDTARRDVIKLTNTGQAIRIHGGLMKIKQGTVPDYNSRAHVLSPIKNKMAKMTAKYLTADKLVNIFKCVNYDFAALPLFNRTECHNYDKFN